MQKIKGGLSSVKKTKKQTENKTKRKVKIVFLCTGNTCRSPMAEQIFKHFLRTKRMLSKFDVRSAGLYAEVNGAMADYAQQAVLALGINLTKHMPTQFDFKLAKKTDIIVCMTENHKNCLDDQTRIKAITFKTLVGQDLNDPYGLSQTQYDMAASQIFFACDRIFDYALKYKKENIDNIDNKK